MPIYNYNPMISEVLVCKKCKHPVERGFQTTVNQTVYSCNKCDAWVLNVEWEKMNGGP